MKAPPLFPRRRRILVNRDFQLRVVTRLASILTFQVVLFTGLAILLPAITGVLGGQGTWGWGETLYRLDSASRFFGLPFLCAVIGFFGFALIEMFHIAGPCYRFSSVFRDLQQLRIPHAVALRQGDHLQDVAAELDRALSTLHGTLTEVRHLAGQAKGNPESLSDLIGLLDEFQLTKSSDRPSDTSNSESTRQPSPARLQHADEGESVSQEDRSGGNDRESDPVEVTSIGKEEP